MRLSRSVALACARALALQVRGWIVRKNDVPFIAIVRSAFDVARTLGANLPSGADFDRMSHAIGPFLVIADDPPDGANESDSDEEQAAAALVETVAHEAEHVGQFWRGEFRDKAPHGDRALEGGVAFAWLYLVEPLARIRFEARAYRAGFEVRHALGVPLPTAEQCVDALFRFYALPDAHREFALTMFESMIVSVARGVVTTDAGKGMIQHLRNHGVLS